MVWVQQLYLEDMLPKMSVEMIKLSNDVNKVLSAEAIVQDYGVDLEEMERRMLGEEKMFFPDHLVPDNPRVDFIYFLKFYFHHSLISILIFSHNINLEKIIKIV